MALNATYFSTPHIGSASVSSASVGTLVATGSLNNSNTIITGAATGTEINDLVFVGTAAYNSGTTIAGILNLWLYNGTTYTLYDSITVAAVAPTSSITPWRQTKSYNNLFLPSASWSLVVTSTVNNQLVQITADAADA